MALFKFLLIFFPTIVFADSYYVDTPEVVTKNENLAPTIQTLIKNELSKNGETVTLDPSTANWVISSSLLNLGNSYIMNVSKSNGKKTVFSDSLKATSMDDIDVVIDRLVRASIKNIPVTKTQTVDSVTQNETRGTTIKQQVERQFYLGFGPGSANNLGSETAGVSWLFGYLWALQDQVSLRLNVAGVNVSDSGADMTSFGIGAQYYFNKSRHSPYISGLLDYTWADSDTIADPNCTFFCDNVGENGWGSTVGLGHHFFRTSTVNFAAELAYTQGFYEVLDKSPNMLNFRVIIFW